jgi:hypothetical protein
MSTMKLIKTIEYDKWQLASSSWFLKNGHFVLPENGTLVPKDVGDEP